MLSDREHFGYRQSHGQRTGQQRRNRAKGEATQAEIKQATCNQHVELLVADLSLLEEVRRLAAEFQHTHHRLHLLVNNAGCAYPTRTLTSEGLEATLAVITWPLFCLP